MGAGSFEKRGGKRGQTYQQQLQWKIKLTVHMVSVKFLVCINEWEKEMQEYFIQNNSFQDHYALDQKISKGHFAGKPKKLCGSKLFQSSYRGRDQPWNPHYRSKLQMGHKEISDFK